MQFPISHRIIDDEKLKKKIQFIPREDQQKIIENNSRIKVICAGRRWGKSAICAYIALRMLLEKNKKIWIVAPSYDLTQKVFTYLVRWFLRVVPSQAKAISYRPFPKIILSTGSTVECKSAENPTSLLGEELDLIIIDEAARIPRRIWESYLYPTLSIRKGNGIFISTPFGKNWFFDEFEKAKKEDGAFRFTSRDNPLIGEKEWNEAKSRLPEQVFKQEYSAMFLDDAASVFRGVKEIIKDNILADCQTNHYYLMGVDLGRHQDFTVITVLDTFNNNLVFFDRFNQIDWNLQKARIIATAQRYNNARVIIDSTGIGDPISEDLQLAGLLVDDFKYTNQSKKQLIDKLSIFIEQKKISIPPIEQLISEIEAFGYNLTESGNITYSAPQGLYDDCVNSLGLAVWGLYGEAVQETLIQRELKKVNKTQITSYI